MNFDGATQRHGLAHNCQSVWRLVGSFLIVFICLLPASQIADAKPKFSAISVDARTGKVLSAVDPDGQRHPASLTKMMTLYLLFQELKSGKLTLNSTISISARAAAMAPSKLGVKPGTTITVEQAIKALVVKSANDVASAVGENLAGSEAAFAGRMTRTARELGMSRTIFRNASGLPNPAQWTTARDMATLGLRLQRDFPQYYPYFGTMSFTYAGRTVKTHNRLLGKFAGADGIKTGYVAASGFNLVSSVKRGDKRIVGAVLGGTSGRSRDAYMKNMLTKVFPNCVDGKTIAAMAGSSKDAIEPLKADTKTADTAKLAAEDTLEAMANASTGDAESAEETAATAPAKAPVEPTVIEARVALLASPEKLPFEVKAKANQAEVTPEAAEPADTLTIASLAAGEWNIQIGSYTTKKAATDRLLGLRANGPAELRDKAGFTVTIKKGENTTYRARFTGFTEKEARELCQELSRENLRCYVVAPSS